MLKRGDIITHIYAPGKNGILDDNGILRPEVMAAHRRGVIFDFGNGVSDHFDWDTVEKATKQGLWPDTFSTDWNVKSKTSGVVDLPNVMSKFIMFGMPLNQIVAAATVNAARCFPAFDDRGTLNVGAPADVAIMELREGTFEFLDNYNGKRTGRQRLFHPKSCSPASACNALESSAAEMAAKLSHQDRPREYADRRRAQPTVRIA